MTPDVQQLVADLQQALGLSVTAGSITLNLSESRLQSVKTETYQRVERTRPVDKQWERAALAPQPEAGA